MLTACQNRVFVFVVKGILTKDGILFNDMEEMNITPDGIQYLLTLAITLCKVPNCKQETSANKQKSLCHLL